jgi:hypothetical protein
LASRPPTTASSADNRASKASLSIMRVRVNRTWPPDCSRCTLALLFLRALGLGRDRGVGLADRRIALEPFPHSTICSSS